MIDNYEKLDIFAKSLRIRMIEERIAEEYPKQRMRCPVHLSIGQEANAVAIARCLSSDDFMVSTHRGHAHYLATGGSIVGLIGELYGKDIGCARGNGGSMHTTSFSTGFIGSTSIVGGTIPIGVGCAFASNLLKDKRVTVVCLGDAAIEQGVFHESANFAALHKLPVIFFMENNKYSCFTPLQLRQPERKLGFRDVATAYVMPYLRVKWTRFYEDVAILKNRISYLKEHQEDGPIFIECDAYRFTEHCGPNDDDNLGYRPPDEVMRFKDLDPIKVMCEQLMKDSFLSESVLEKLKLKIKAEIDAAFEIVHNASAPPREDLGRFLYA